MVEFVSITAHGAVVYLHVLLALRQFPTRKESFALYAFWLMMVAYACLHALYAVKIFSGEQGWIVVQYYVDIAAVWLLTCTPPALIAVLFGELTELPQNRNVLARTLRVIGTRPRPAAVVGLAVSVGLILYGLEDLPPLADYRGELGATVLSLWFAMSLAGLWIVAYLSGLRPADHSTRVGRAIAILFLLLMPFFLVMVIFDPGRYWSIIPLVGTASFSFVFAWFRFRFQFVDVVLRRFIQFVFILAAVGLGYQLFTVTTDQPLSSRLVATLIYVLAAAWLAASFSRWIDRLWTPTADPMNEIHEHLPRALSECTSQIGAIRVTEHLLSRIFRADVAVNGRLADARENVRLSGDSPVELALGYIRGWMPWLSEGLAAARTAALYLQAHLQVLKAMCALQAQRIETQALSELAAKAELSAMHARIRPHFLFNTLNSIHGFVRDDPTKAQHTIELLADLMRGVVRQGDVDLCPLDKELGLAQSYLDIQRIRHGERLHFSIRAGEDARRALVPPFSVQPLVENAVKFAVESTMQACAVIAVEAGVDEGELCVSVTDNGPGLDHTDADGFGMALENIRERIARLLGDHATLTLTDQPSGGVAACLRAPATYK